jgi:subfamily B ATP-binding cassette protein MsbA
VIHPADLRVLRALFGRFARPHWRLLVLLTVVSTLAALAAAVQPLVLAPALDTALLSHAEPAHRLSALTLNNLGPTLLARLGLEGGRPFRVLVAVVALYVLAVLVAASLSFASLQLMRWIRTAIANDIQATLYRHLLSLSMPFFLAQRVGELTNRLVYDVISTAQAFDPVVSGLLGALLQIAVYGLLMFRTDSGLAVAVLAVALLHVGITRLLERQIRRRTADSFNAYADISATAQEALAGIRIVKSFSAEAFEQARLQRLLGGLKRIVLRFGFYSNSEAPLREVANAIAIATALLLAFRALSTGRLTLSGFVMFIVVARQAIGPFSTLGTALLQMQSMIGSSQRVLEILEQRPTLKDGSLDAPALSDRIRISGVSFGYHPGTPVLEGIDLDIPRGTVTAIVGPSGAGKSTLADLVLRLHDPDRGRVTFDDRDIREFKQESYRRHFGVVSQEALLFNATVEENIAYGRVVARDDIVRAARIANAEEFIEGLPDGFQTQVGERGTRLSGGQRQRIAIARAVYGRPDLLILDEATSSLDSESEGLVQAGMDRAVEGTTAIVIAHRLSTVMKADRIVVLDHGRVVGSGRHTDLVGANALYRRLYNAQFPAGDDLAAVDGGLARHP